MIPSQRRHKRIRWHRGLANAERHGSYQDADGADVWAYRVNRKPQGNEIVDLWVLRRVDPDTGETRDDLAWDVPQAEAERLAEADLAMREALSSGEATP